VRTVYGVLADELGHASAGGRAWASPAAAYLREQGPEVPVDRDHSHRWLGQVVFLARNAGRLWAVAEVGGVAEAIKVRVGNRTVEVPTPLYWSATRRGGVDDGLGSRLALVDGKPGSHLPPPGHLPRRLTRSPAGGRSLAVEARPCRVRASAPSGRHPLRAAQGRADHDRRARAAAGDEARSQRRLDRRRRRAPARVPIASR
jgi:hypothetical protein